MSKLIKTQMTETVVAVDNQKDTAKKDIPPIMITNKRKPIEKQAFLYNVRIRSS